MLLVFPVTVGDAVNLCPAAAESASPEPPQDYVNNSGEKKSCSSCTFNEIVLSKKKGERERNAPPLSNPVMYLARNERRKEKKEQRSAGLLTQ